VVHAADGKVARFRAQLDNAGSYAWAASGALFAYQTKQGVGIAGPDGQVRALRGARSPSWAPTGTRLAVGRAGRVELLDAPNGTPHTLVHGESPSWSPTGDWIAYGVQQCGPRQGIHLIHPDGTGDHRLTRICSIDANGARVVHGTPFNDVISADDGRRQRIVCGAGADLVYADPADAVARDCERVLRPH
jgi:dipeptidyl aminopeptidase/acylaminoacyl peptidase